MIKGVGCDIVEIERISRAAGNKKFLEKCFSPAEIVVFEQRQSACFLAGNFAAKEAVVKAAGRGFRGILPREIEVLRDCLGAPYVVITDEAAKNLSVSEDQIIHVSISNTKDTAMATAIIEQRP